MNANQIDFSAYNASRISQYARLLVNSLKRGLKMSRGKKKIAENHSGSLGGIYSSFHHRIISWT